MKKNKTKLGIAQINTLPGVIEQNAIKIIKNIKKAKEQNLDLIVFPAFSLTGANVDDAYKRHTIIFVDTMRWLIEIAEFTKDIAVVVGKHEEGDHGILSSLVIMYDGKIQDVVNKKEQKNIEIKGVTYRFVADEEIERLLRIKPKVDVIVNCSASISRPNTSEEMQVQYSKVASKLSIPIVHVNQTGAVDCFSYAGESKVFDKNGNITACAKSFEEDFLVVNPFKESKKENKPIFTPQKEFSLDYEFDLERIYKSLTQGIRDYFSKNGLKRAVLGLSGGLDSTVCAVLLTDALGAENVLGVSMPSKLTSSESKTDAEQLANNLGIGFIEAPIKEMVDTTDKNLQKVFKSTETIWDSRYKKSFTMDNIQARSRAAILFGISNEFESCIPIATSDKSEAYMGYATINGDMSGGYAPIADVTKTKLFALAKWLNKNREVKNAIPESIIQKRPGAELAIDPNTGKTLCAEDALMPYEFMDEVIWNIENKRDTFNQMLKAKFLYEKNHKLTKKQKKEWLEKFYKRMGSALYKGSIMPPFVIVDSNSINKNEYFQPITSAKINYRGLAQEEIQEKIKNLS